MLKLPFKTEPQKEFIVVGDRIIGELEIPKYGDLTANERIYIKQAGLTDLRKAAVNLAKIIAAKSDISVIGVYSALTSGDAETLKAHLSEFVDFQELMEENAKRRDLVLATCIIKFRLLPEWEIQDTQDGEKIKPLLVSALADFAKKEESGWAEIDVSETTEEDLGNLTTQASQTGEKSSGESGDIGLASQDLSPTNSEASQPG
jgi:hypothetical protein